MVSIYHLMPIRVDSQISGNTQTERQTDTDETTTITLRRMRRGLINLNIAT